MLEVRNNLSGYNVVYFHEYASFLLSAVTKLDLKFMLVTQFRLIVRIL